MNRILTICLILVGVSFAVQAGGPLNTKSGAPVRYLMASPITYKTDLGFMGSFSNVTATGISVTSFQVWQDVATATVAFTNGGQLPADVTSANYGTYLDNFSDGINPIIFDHDGSIIDAILGAGSHNNVIGFAGSAFNTSTGLYVDGQAVMNGTMAGSGPSQFNEQEFQSTFVHEFGHFIGLDHAQINAQFVGNGITGDDIYIPTMYPTSTDDDVPLGALNPDDIIAVSNIYPEASFSSATGIITGTVTRFDASVVRGANVVAIKTTDSLMYRVSTVSDYFEQNDGVYVIAGLEPGTYWVQMEKVRPSFTGGSSVGPYASSGSDISFQDPVITEYYNGPNESDDPDADTVTSRTELTVVAGQGVNANLVANRVPNAPATSIIQYHGSAAFVFRLPSWEMDMKYAVRFTPGATAHLTKVDFQLNGTANAITGTGSLRVTVHQNTAGSVAGVPGAQMGGAVSRSFSAMSVGVFNEVDLTSLNDTVQQNVNFHIAFEVQGSGGDTIQFLGDDGSNVTNRSSSFYDAGEGPQWYNFTEPGNFGSYNLVVRAYINIVTGAGNEEVMLLPDRFELLANYPNPFNPETNIPFRLSERSRVSLNVYDLLGRLVRTIMADQDTSPGEHAARFEANGLPTGTYVAVLSVDGQRQMRKLMLVK